MNVAKIPQADNEQSDESCFADIDALIVKATELIDTNKEEVTTMPHMTRQTLNSIWHKLVAFNSQDENPAALDEIEEIIRAVKAEAHEEAAGDGTCKLEFNHSVLDEVISVLELLRGDRASSVNKLIVNDLNRLLDRIERGAATPVEHERIKI